VSDSKLIPLSASDEVRRPLEPAEELARQWEQGNRVGMDALLKSTGPLTAGQLAEVFHVDQHHRWEAGERVTAESYLQRFPEVLAEPEAAIDVIFHEFLLREQLGEPLSCEEYPNRFPQYAESLRSQIAFHRLLKESNASLAESHVDASTASMPADGQTRIGSAARMRSGLVARAGLSSTRELQVLLRQRLRLFALASCVIFLFQVPVVWTVVAGFFGAILYFLVIAITGIFAAVLSSHRRLSLKALRWMEACLIGSLLVISLGSRSRCFEPVSSCRLPGVAGSVRSWPRGV
jgi:hypothetical protein